MQNKLTTLHQMLSYVHMKLIKNIKKDEEYDIYIGRSPQGKKVNPLCNSYHEHIHGDRKKCIQMFAYDFRVKWKLNPEFRQAIIDATDKRLGCFCHPKTCHGEVIVAFTQGLKKGGVDMAFDNISKYIYGDFEC